MPPAAAAAVDARSTARLSSGQRTALNDIEEAHSEDREGQTYIVYEHTSQVCDKTCLLPSWQRDMAVLGCCCLIAVHVGLQAGSGCC
jgi:hypothetical protein